MEVVSTKIYNGMTKTYPLTRCSYIVYVALIAGYLVLILFFFPETRYGYTDIVTVVSLSIILNTSRNMTIEEVSVLFDTGREGDAQAAALTLSHGARGKDIEMTAYLDYEDGAERGAKNAVSHVESVDKR